MTRQRALELAASITTLLGQGLGSTVLAGAWAYLIADVIWIILMIEARLWGLAPLNLISLVLAVRILANFYLF